MKLTQKTVAALALPDGKSEAIFFDDELPGLRCGPSSTTVRAAMTSYSGERINAMGHKLEPWVIHDLRRTMATRMAESGTPPHIIEAILNHASGHKAGVAGIYNRASYEPQKRISLEKWSNHLETLISGKRSSKVVNLYRA